MISYKRDVLDRQSLSEVKMGRGSPICERVRKKLWNTLKTTFLNVKLQRLCKSYHLQCITSSKDSEKLEKSLCIRDKTEDLCWMPVVFGPSDDTCITHRHRVLWAKAHLKWTVSKWKSVLWSDESKFDILAGNHGRCVLRAKEEGDLPACHQRSVQKPASLMVLGSISAYGMGSLHVLDSTMNAERYIML